MRTGRATTLPRAFSARAAVGNKENQGEQGTSALALDPSMSPALDKPLQDTSRFGFRSSYTPANSAATSVAVAALRANARPNTATAAGVPKPMSPSSMRRPGTANSATLRTPLSQRSMLTSASAATAAAAISSSSSSTVSRGPAVQSRLGLSSTSSRLAGSASMSNLAGLPSPSLSLSVSPANSMSSSTSTSTSSSLLGLPPGTPVGRPSMANNAIPAMGPSSAYKEEYFEDLMKAEPPAIFTDELLSSLNNVMNAKITSKMFDFKLKGEQQAALIKNMKAVLKQSQDQLAIGQRTVDELVNDRRILLSREREASMNRERTEFKIHAYEDEIAKLREVSKTAQRAAMDARASLATMQSEMASKAGIESKAHELEVSSKETTVRLQQAELQLATLKERFKREEEITAELKAKLDAKGRELSQAISAFQDSQTFLQERATTMQKQVSDMLAAKHEAELQLRDARSEIASLKSALQTLEDTLSSASNEKSSAVTERDNMRSNNSALQSQLDLYRTQCAETAAALQSVQAELAAVSTALALEKEAREHEAQLRLEVQGKAARLESDLTSSREQVSELTSETKSLRQELMSSKDEWSRQKEALKDQLVAEKEEWTQKLQNAETQHQVKVSALEASHAERVQAMEGLHAAKMHAEQVKFSAEKQEQEAKYETLAIQSETQAKILQEQVNISREDREKLTKVVYEKEAEIDRLTMEVRTLRRNVGVTQEKALANICELELDNKHLRAQVANKEDLLKKLEEQEATLKDLRAQMFAGETMRRRMHNIIQELKGNIRVICRVRPLLKHDDETEYRTLDCGADEKTIKLYTGSEKPYSYSFDRTLPPQTTQEGVFEEVSQLVQSALDGYNVCLFSYGQTGSGKTHTMTGGKGKDAGIIPRSVVKILETAAQYNAQGWTYRMEASFSEIYNSKLNDLLDDEAAKDPNSKSLEIKRVDNKTVVPGLTRVPVTSAAALDALMSRAVRNRATATTDMNERSSRSHCIFTLYLHGVNEEQKTELVGTLNLCDLAGSERLDRSGAIGERLKETQAINKSLSCLSDVFQALSKGSAHVPFRNSKLTYLLQDCFAGDGKTMMVVNLSPTMGSTHESLCSLRFASTVSQVHMGTAKKNISKIPGGSANASSSSSSALTYAGDAEDGAEEGGACGSDEEGVANADESFVAPLCTSSSSTSASSAASTPTPTPGSASGTEFKRRPVTTSGPSYMASTSSSSVSSLRKPPVAPLAPGVGRSATASASAGGIPKAAIKPRTFNK